MTGRLLIAAAEIKGSPASLVCVWLVVFALLPSLVLADVAFTLWRRHRLRHIFSLTEVRCPRDHIVVVRASELAWECATCGYSAVATSAFAPCGRCHQAPGFVGCACGASLENPAYPLLERR